MALNVDRQQAMQNIGQIASHNTNTNSNWVAHLDHVNAVELDVWPLNNWLVSHDFDVGAGHLEGYMKDLADWRAAHPDHDLITVFIEIKSKEGWKVEDFESILTRHLQPSDLFCPRDLVTWAARKRFAASTLRALVQGCGWPTFSEVQRKVMFVINNAGDHVVDTYLAERALGSGSDPLCFVMSSESDNRTGHENIVIFNGEYDALATSGAHANCLRRAYLVKSGNDELVNGDTSVATGLMKDKKINYLAYDVVDNAFSIALT
jgi:hypothetical protein